MPSVDALAVLRINNAAGALLGMPTRSTSEAACCTGLKVTRRGIGSASRTWIPPFSTIFVAFLRAHFHVEDTRIRITCDLFADHEPRQREIEDFWLGTLGLQRSSLCKSIINRYSRYSQKKRKNKLPYGTCRVAVNSTEIAQTIYGSIQELAGFDRPEWVDMPA
jgi:hypothetical protein